MASGREPCCLRRADSGRIVPMDEAEENNVSPSGFVRFRSYPPSARLSLFVRNFWTMHSEGPLAVPRKHRVLPDGCIDMIFVRHSRAENYTACVAGTMTRPIFAELRGHVDYLGVRFVPGGFRHLFDAAPAELTDRVVPLAGLFARAGLAEQIAGRDHVRARLEEIENQLSRRLRSERPDAILTQILATISACRGNVTVAQLARLADCSPRHLRRMFRRAVGIGPKTFCRITRFRAALRALRRPRPDLLAVALEAGYYDQAHCIHDFNDLYGASPSAALEEPML
jgi:AraC-like DNA-binding protein